MDPRDPPHTLRENADLRELLRMIRAVIRDGEISELEGEFIRFWLAAHPELVKHPPLSRVVSALQTLMEEKLDGKHVERASLLEVLEEAARALECPDAGA